MSGATVLTVTPYRWVKPDGADRLPKLIEAACSGNLDVLTFTSAPAVDAMWSTAHEMGVYKRYFDLIASGEKTTEIRVDDSSRKRLKESDPLRFKCRDEEVLTRINRNARYVDFDEMFDHEPSSSVNPIASKADQLRNIREIYPPEREALGVVAIGVELVKA